MNHPNPEAWVPYLFGEAAPAQRDELKQHLKTCPECRAAVDSWRQSLARLDAWKLEAVPRERSRPLLRWAAAGAFALVLGAAGFAFGRLTSPSPEQLRARLAAELRPQLQRELAPWVQAETARAIQAASIQARTEATKVAADYALASESRRRQDKQSMDAALERLESQRLADFILLKQDVDTIAVNTDEDLRDTRQKLVQLAAFPPKQSTAAPQN